MGIFSSVSQLMPKQQCKAEHCSVPIRFLFSTSLFANGGSIVADCSLVHGKRFRVKVPCKPMLTISCAVGSPV